MELAQLRKHPTVFDALEEVDLFLGREQLEARDLVKIELNGVGQLYLSPRIIGKRLGPGRGARASRRFRYTTSGRGHFKSQLRQRAWTIVSPLQ
jgi:hypothetical protein